MEAKLAEIKRKKLLEAIQRNAEEASTMEAKILHEEEQRRNLTLQIIKKERMEAKGKVEEEIAFAEETIQ